MDYYIFDTKRKAKGYDTKCTNAENYPIKGDNWCNPIKHPEKDLWAVQVNEKVLLSDMEAQELTQDWTYIS